MSPNPYPIFKISPQDEPEQLEKRVGVLVRLYLSDKNRFIAAAVVEHINAILAAPGFIMDVRQRCILRRLARHWHCIAQLEGAVANEWQQLKD